VKSQELGEPADYRNKQTRGEQGVHITIFVMVILDESSDDGDNNDDDVVFMR